MAGSFEVELAAGGRARAVRVVAPDELDEAISALGIPRGPVVLLYGGAGRLEERHRARIERFFARSFIPAIVALDAIVIDGGTDAGIMRMVGDAREHAVAPVVIVGVAPFGKVRVPGSDGSTELAPGHSGFLLVPGADWGSEVRWFHAIAGRVSSGGVTSVLVNGGPVALDEIEQSLDHGSRVLVVDGSGRAADDISAAIRRPDGQASRLSKIATSPSVVVVDVMIGPGDLEDMLRTNIEGGIGG